MALNSSPINSTPINAILAAPGITGIVTDGVGMSGIGLDQAGRVEVIAENIAGLDTPLGTRINQIFEDLTISDTSLFQLINIIREQITLTENAIPQSNRSMSVLDNISLDDKILVELLGIISENITTAETLSALLNLYGTLQEHVSTSDTLSSSATQNVLIASAFTLNAALNLTEWIGTIEEGVTTSEALTSVYMASEALSELLSVSDLPTNHIRISVLADETVDLAGVLASQSVMNDLIEEDAVFILSFDDGSTVYQGFTLNPETFSVSEYDNYNFNSSAEFNGDYLLANSTGLYTMEGGTDAGDYITSKITTAALDFDTSSIKQCPKVYLGINNDASLILRVSVDGKYTSTYELELDSQDLTTQIFNIGKGLKGRYWQFELQTKGNSEFDVDELEFFPIQWGRKL